MNIDLLELTKHYIPGFFYFVALVIAHILLATIVHIKQRDFNFKEWPSYMKNFIYFMVFLVFINGLREVVETRLENDFVSSLLFGLQAFIYAQPIGYYLDNILTSLSKLGFPVSPELSSMVKETAGYMKNMIGR